MANLTHSYQEKASETNLRITRWGIRRNCHREILRENFPILLRIERTIEQNGAQVRRRTDSGHRAWCEPYDESGLY